MSTPSVNRSLLEEMVLHGRVQDRFTASLQKGNSHNLTSIAELKVAQKPFSSDRVVFDNVCTVRVFQLLVAADNMYLFDLLRVKRPYSI